MQLGGGIESMVSDPPYGMAFQSNHRIEKHSSIANDDCAELLVWACDLPATHSKYIFCRWDNLREVPKPKSLVTWVKNNWSMGDLKHEHARQTEVALFYPGPNHFFPTGRPTDVVDARRTGNGNHPTEKPISLMMTVVGWTSGTVFDPFMGSGTTGVACARMGRPFIGVEIDEEYFEIACDRIAKAHSQADLFVSPGARPKFEQVPLFANDNTITKAA
ncbi:Methyltransferase (modular protein) [Hyphomicrobiales bacterium]|nr:Methyltransferase (modular protein) [Hyphomicrobiales bacterium]CAH1669403.1 Methyltransferase (modular protein) [Hyphomicrobiales bacterium]